MATPTQNVHPVKSLAMPCLQCGAREMQRTPRSTLQKLLAVCRNVCSRCGWRQTEFRPTLITAAGFLFLVVMVAGSIFAYTQNITIIRRGEDAPQNAAEIMARTSAGGLSAFERMMLRKPRNTLNNDSVLELWRANVGSEIILRLIRTSNADYDISPKSVIAFREAGVDKIVILAMIDASFEAP